MTPTVRVDKRNKVITVSENVSLNWLSRKLKPMSVDAINLPTATKPFELKQGWKLKVVQGVK